MSMLSIKEVDSLGLLLQHVYIFNSWVLPNGCLFTGGEARVAGPIHLATAAWGINLTAKALRSFPFSNCQVCGSISLVMRETQQWGRAGPERLKLPCPSARNCS
jgi:hypothetical protein